MAVKIFISWSGKEGQRLGKELQNWIHSVIHAVEPYFTPEDTAKGARWGAEIADELDKSQFGIVCLTRGSLRAPWIFFEAGALSKNTSAQVCPILFDVDVEDIETPLQQFQCSRFTKSDMFKLVTIINERLGKQKLREEFLRRSFEKWWPDFEKQVKEIKEHFRIHPEVQHETKSDTLKEMLDPFELRPSFGSNKPGGRSLAESFVKHRAEEMKCKYHKVKSSASTVYAHLQIIDNEGSGSYCYMGVYIQPGELYCKFGRRNSVIFTGFVERDLIVEWKENDMPSIAIWVVGNGADREAFWANAADARLESGRIVLRPQHRFNKKSLPGLLRIVRQHKASLAIPGLRQSPCFPARVSDVKKAAWEFYADWRERGCMHPQLGKIDITLKGWRHITRRSVPQRAICHRLSLLPLARELIESGAEPKLVREFDGGKRKLLILIGLLRPRYRAAALVTVVVEKQKLNSDDAIVRFYSVHERRIWNR